MGKLKKQANRYSNIPFEPCVSGTFYSKENQESLQKSISDYYAGKKKLVTKSMEELETIDNE